MFNHLRYLNGQIPLHPTKADDDLCATCVVEETDTLLYNRIA